MESGLTGEYAVLEAGDGEAAWALLLAHHPRVAVLDVQMPGRDGLELTRAIRREPALDGTRVILLTAHAQQGAVRAGRAAGVDVYLTKPFSPLQVLAEVRAGLGPPTLAT